MGSEPLESLLDFGGLGRGGGFLGGTERGLLAKGDESGEGRGGRGRKKEGGTLGVA